MNSTEECSEMMEKDVHVTFLEMMYHLLPSPYESQETNHMTLAYFIISGLDILNALHSVEKDAVANWVLSFQVHPRPQADLKDGQFYGFHGSKSSQFPPDEKGV